MSSIRQKVRKKLDEIIELEKKIAIKRNEITKLYSTCNHDFHVILSGHIKDYFKCNLCGYEETKDHYDNKL